ncbi:hypothetical protein ACFPFV_11820 [Salinicoccus siamensis]|uniref:Lipoprotein n=1 Tax=Salinicoccus siamensis TaxID=381830 RepID=A0ABV5Z4W6_9STAP
MKKQVLLFVFLASCLFTGCDDQTDELSGRSFNLIYPTTLPSGQSNHQGLTVFTFKDGTVETPYMNDVEGEYALKEEELKVVFQEDSQKLKITFEDFDASTKNYSTYSAIIEQVELKTSSNQKARGLSKLKQIFKVDFPVEFLER